KRKGLFEEPVPVAAKPVKRPLTGSSASSPPLPPVGASPGPLVEPLPTTPEVCRCGAPRPLYREPLPIRGGTEMEVEKLRKLLDDSTLREKDVLKRLRESEMQVRALTSMVGSYTRHDPDLLLGGITELDDEVRSPRSQLHAFSYLDFHENRAKVAELTDENTSLRSNLSECISRALGACVVSFGNALDQVELYLGWSLPRDKFDPQCHVRRGKLVPYARPVENSGKRIRPRMPPLSFPQGLPLVRGGSHGN
ncbi:hypothetical protein A2U01_0020803, partial [Trifolium medium]|nr:hypothetical protein [Trifolium medium]